MELEPIEYVSKKRTLILLITGLLFVLSCSDKCKLLSDVNSSETIGDFLSKENPARECATETSPKKINLSIKHESACNLKDYELQVWLNHHTIYKGNYLESIPLDFNICKDQPYEISVFILDSKKNVYYAWNKKDAYTLSEKNFNTITISLYEKNNFDYSNGIEYDISFNK